MYRACIAVVDASRARLFTYERSVEPEGLTDDLREQRDLIDPARRLRPAQLFSETRPGSSRTGGLHYAFDDHRDKHIDAMDVEFAHRILDEITALIRAHGAERLILCASPRMLGELRGAGFGMDIAIDEVPRDLVKLTPPQLRDRLASYGLLLARPAASSW